MNRRSVWFTRALVLALFLVVGCLGLGKTSAYAGSGDGYNSSLYYLYQNQNVDGGLKDKGLSDSEDLETAWGALAFASMGYDPATVKHTDSQGLIKNIEKKACGYESITDIERTALVVMAGNLDPRDFGGCDLLSKITTDPESGKIGPDLMSTIYGVYVYGAADLPISENTVNYIITNQREDGGFDPLGWGEDSNTTAQALVALIDAGVDRESPSVQLARQFLKNLQVESGGIKYDYNFWTTDQDAFSDAYTLQAITALGENPKDDFWLAGGKSILDGLELLKQPDGSYFYSLDPAYGNSTPVWTTAIVTLGLSGSGFPIAGQVLTDYPRLETLQAIKEEDGDDTGKKVDDQIVDSLPSNQTVLPEAVLTSVPTNQPKITQSLSAPISEPQVVLTSGGTNAINQNPDTTQQVLGEAMEPEKINFWYLVILIAAGLSIGIFIARMNRGKRNES